MASLQLEHVQTAGDPRIAVYRNIREKDLVGREGLFIAEGKVVLSVLLSSTLFSVRSILVTENRFPGLLPLLEIHKPDCPIYIATQSVMDQIAGFHVHRGILGLGARSHITSLVDFLGSLPERALLVALCGISNHDNVGSIFRNAAAFAADGIVMDKTCCDPLYRKAIRVSVGAALKVPYVQGDTVSQMLDVLEEAGFTTIAFSPSAQRRLQQVEGTKRTALLFGTEGEGLPREIMQRLQTVRIPIAADFDSLNVATASGIALSHFALPERLA